MAGLNGVTSILFVPGSRPDRFAKALAAGAGLVVIDLEDAVSPEDKGQARADVAMFVRETSQAAVRVNQLVNREGLADLLALAEAPPAAVFCPKVESAGILAAAAGALPGVPIVPLIETPEGLTHAAAIARAPGVAAIMLGGADLCAELGVPMSWDALLHARGALALAAAGAGVPAVDVPSLELNDPQAVHAEAQRVKALGFAAKAAIHPGQIEPIARAFAPAAEDVAEAREALAAFRINPGAARHRGKLLEAPIVRRFERLLAQQEAQAHA